MSIPIAAFAVIVLSALNLLSPGLLPAPAQTGRDLLVLLLAAYIAFAAWKRRPPGTADVPAAAPQPPPPVSAPPAAVSPKASGEALVLLSMLQDKGRFLDFLMEDITAYKDPQVAAASRVVHQGCAAVIREYLDLSPVHEGKEGDRLDIEPSSDPNRYRLVGKVTGQPPFSGVVVHRGWKTSKLALPRLTREIDQAGPNLITPIEVELR